MLSGCLLEVHAGSQLADALAMVPVPDMGRSLGWWSGVEAVPCLPRVGSRQSGAEMRRGEALGARVVTVGSQELELPVVLIALGVAITLLVTIDLGRRFSLVPTRSLRDCWPMRARDRGIAAAACHGRAQSTPARLTKHLCGTKKRRMASAPGFSSNLPPGQKVVNGPGDDRPHEHAEVRPTADS